MDEAEDPSDRVDPDIDPQAALAMAGGDMALLRDLAGAFLKEVPQLLEAIRVAVEQRDSESLQTATHQLQGVMRCLHVERPLVLAQELERLAQAATDWTAIERLLSDVNSATGSAIDALNKFLDE